MSKRTITLITSIVGILLVVFVRNFSSISLSDSTPVQTTGSNASQTGTISLITEPDDGMGSIISMINAASTSVDIVMYEFEDTDVEKALAADVARGVHVRVLLNEGYYGKKENTLNDSAYAYFQAHNIEVHWTPSYFALTHQKTAVLDGHTAVIMTMNFTPQYYASGREFAVVDTDTRDVSAIESAFDTDWNNNHVDATNGNALVWSPGSEDSMLSMINSAQKSLEIYNEEMADTSITHALEGAAHRGIDVEVVMTYSSNWKKAFQELTTSGVHIHTFAAKAPLYIHAKVIIKDNQQAFIGSENFSSNSLLKNRELGIIVTDPTTISSLESTFQKDRDDGTSFQ